jgi:hypothetical protein
MVVCWRPKVCCSILHSAKTFIDTLSRTEKHPPWDPRSDHYKLLRSCQEFKASLPRNYTLTPQNIQSHITIHESTPYTLVHTVYLLCQIMLHREYVPFIPLRCKKPEGPLDPPLFPTTKYDVPTGYWEDSAQQCFKAARDLVDLVRTCQEWNVLVESPIVGFAIYTVAFVGVYCINFPWMDPRGYMCTQIVENPGAYPAESKGFEAARKALEIIGQMRPRLHMAAGWFKTINRMHRYLRRMKKDFAKNTQANESASESGSSPTSSRQLSLREGGVGGGLDEYKLLERTLKEFGNLDDQDIEMADVNFSNKPLDTVYDDNSNSGTTVKSEEGDRPTQHDQSKADGPWNAINAAPGAGRQTPTSAPTTNGGWRSYEPLPAPGPLGPQTQSAPPVAYNQPQVNNFRPVYQHHDAAGPPGVGMSSLTSPSPGTRTASLSSQASPAYNHHNHHHAYNTWNAHTQGYAMQPPPPGYAVAPNSQPQPMMNAMHAYPTPGSQVQPMGPPQHMAETQQIYDPMAKEAWLNSVNTGLGGDDVAAFVDGGEMEDWASMAASRGFGQGWLSTVWGGGNGV